MKISELNFKEHGDPKFGYKINIPNEKADDSLRQISNEIELVRFKSDFIEIWGDVEISINPYAIWSERIVIEDERFQKERMRFYQQHY